MNLIITGRRYNVSPGLKKAIEEKLGRIRVLENQKMQFHVLLEKEKLNFIADISFVLDGKRFYFQTKEPTVAEAIDNLTDKLERHIRKHKERVHAHARNTHTLTADTGEAAPFDYAEVSKELRSELDVVLHLANSDSGAEVFYSGDNPGCAMAALQESDELFAVYGCDPGGKCWYCKHIYLAGDQIDHTRIEDCYAEQMGDREAYAKIEKEAQTLLLYTNAESNKVQAMLREEDKLRIYILEK
ncbi:MAG: ribosome-associated translation inhibitor RaiA [Spirochaetota bacterium]|jgi:putative sigma-54 modulation protein|nr:ribosome-associated translation inhibitor RaiA [Spirochaetota bacterium]